MTDCWLRTSRRLQAILWPFLMLPVQGMILVTGDNAANQSAPDSARTDIFNAVAQVVTDTGTGGYGSAVHVRGKYLLTAHHVNVTNGSHVTFDGGNTLWQRDTAFTPRQIGTADLKLIKLIEDPGLPDKQLFTAAEGDVPYTAGVPPQTVYTTATIVGVGIGRSSSDSDGNLIWNWGANSTMAKRWGLNRIEGSINPLEYDSYSYEALYTTLEAGSGDNEAAVTRYDSGCGLFVEHNGVWKIAGIATAVQTNGSSTFDDLAGDANYFVRIKTYAADIEAAIPDLDTYSGWKVDHSLYDADANDSADTDGDGIPQLLEYALGGDPKQMDLSILPTQQVVDDGGTEYLELVVTRPIGLQGINYVPQTDTTLTSWPTDSTGIADPNPAPTDNGDGTETLIYRRAQALSDAARAFMRLKVESN